MSRPFKPSGLDPAYLRECIDVLSAEPPLLRWRVRPRAHFQDRDDGDVFTSWNKSFASQVVRPQADGRMRITITGPDGVRRTLDARAIVTEIGVTPIGDQQVVQGNAPNDRLGEHRALA